jgi:Uma2 family endonuclease
MVPAEIAALSETLRDLPTLHEPPYEGHPIEELLPKVELVESDGIPMDSAWHRMCMDLLLAAIAFHFRGREDYYAGGNMFIYYSENQARNHDYRGPDVFFVKDTQRLPIRPYWCVWMEDGKYPNAIIELMSPSTARIDLTTKKDIYESRFRTPEYFCYDPAKRRLFGWRLDNGKYQLLAANDAGRLWSEQFGLWLGPWEGSVVGYTDWWLRFFDNDGSLVLTETEFTRQQAAIEQQRAEEEHQRAEAGQQRAIAAEAEVERLKALLAQQGKSST